MPDIRIGVIGAGPWGRNLVRAFRSTFQASVTAICDIDPHRLDGLRLAGTSIRLTDDVDSLIGCPALDAVVIATPAHTHAALALRALDAGHHVFVEKPMALTVADADLLRKRANASARRLMVGHVLLYHPAVNELLALVRTGELGDVREVHSRRLCTSERARTEGPWWSLAPHDVSLMRSIFQREPISISAVARSTACPQRVEGTLGFERERRGTITVGLREDTNSRKVLVIGTRKTALFDDRAPHADLVVFERGRRESDDLFDLPATGRRIPHAQVEPLLIEARRFVESILSGTPPPSDANEGHAVVRVLEVGAASIRAGGRPLDMGDEATAGSMELERLAHGPRVLQLEPLF